MIFSYLLEIPQKKPYKIKQYPTTTTKYLKQKQQINKFV